MPNDGAERAGGFADIYRSSDQAIARVKNSRSIRGYSFDCFIVGTFGSIVILAILFLGRLAHLTTASPELALGRILAPSATALAWVLGVLWFLANGGVIALAYAAVFQAVKRSGWAVGAAFGLAQALLAAFVYQALLELPGYIPDKFPDPGSLLPPESLGFGDGRWTVALILLSHGLYGTILGIWCKRSEKRL